MKFHFAALLTLAFTQAVFAGGNSSDYSGNTDCYLGIDNLIRQQGCIYIGDGLPCSTWGDFGPVLWTPLTRTSETHYELQNSEYSVNVSADLNGRLASFRIEAPKVAYSQKVQTDTNAYGSDLSAGVDTEFHNDQNGTGYLYKISCNFGLSDEVNHINQVENAEMDKLGPPAQWSDPQAPSIQKMPIGTLFVLNRDLDVDPSVGTYDIVEDHGLMTDDDFMKLELPFRYAFAKFFDPNNNYMYAVHYPKGMVLGLTGIEVTGEIELDFKTVSMPAGFSGTIDPINRMEVDGRRGTTDVKIPQFVEFMKPVFDIKLQ